MAEFRQEMPPSGGYKPISFKRVPAKGFFSGKLIFVVNNYVIKD